MRGCTVFSGSSHPKLVETICERLGQKPANVALKKFSNGETSVEISQYQHKSGREHQAYSKAETSVREQDVFIVQSGSTEYVSHFKCKSCRAEAD